MNDDVKEQNSMPPEELKRQIMSYSEPKNEREWWAMHRIEQLEAAKISVKQVECNNGSPLTRKRRSGGNHV